MSEPYRPGYAEQHGEGRVAHRRTRTRRIGQASGRSIRVVLEAEDREDPAAAAVARPVADPTR
ncbi:hypothetical protein MRBLWH7_002184 [Microbacterium sp. LWH7-1.2]|jgi:hypothetical protein|uniref:hypothetical protein n=1 Tax=Microbacterium sp. LWH7-1.2 TaxID=3135257 RepID=UPI00313933A0